MYGLSRAEFAPCSHAGARGAAVNVARRPQGLPRCGRPRWAPPRVLATSLPHSALTQRWLLAPVPADPNAMSSRDVVVVVVMEEPGWYSGGIGVYTESGKVELVRGGGSAAAQLSARLAPRPASRLRACSPSPPSLQDINGRISNVLGHAESLTTKLALKRSSEWSLEVRAGALLHPLPRPPLRTASLVPPPSRPRPVPHFSFSSAQGGAPAWPPSSGMRTGRSSMGAECRCVPAPPPFPPASLSG